MTAAPNLPTPNLVRAALAAWAEDLDARVLWDELPDGVAYNVVGVLPRDVEEAAKTGVLRVYPIGPSEADDPDGDDATAFADDLWDALTDYGWFVQGSRIPFEPIYVAVNREAFAAYLAAGAAA